MKLFTQADAGFTAGAADNDLVWTSPLLARFKEFIISETSVAADVEVSIDGTNFVSTAVALEDVHVAAAVGTRVLLTAVNKAYRIAPGLRIQKLRIRQAAAGALTTFNLLCVTKDE